MAKTFSLCLTTQKINDKDKAILFRLADKMGNELQEPNIENDLSSVYEEKGYPYPYTSSNNHIIGQLKIWEWDPQVREWAKKTSILFYELIEAFDITSLKEKNILQLLKNGHAIPNYCGQKALLVIDEEENFYKVIEIDSSIVTVVNGIAKLNKNTLKINGYVLNKKDFFCTEKVVVLSSNGENLPPRIIYKYLSMREPDFIIETLSFNDKIEIFFNKQIKIYKFSKAQQRDIKNLFIEILSDYDEISDFFIENGFNSDGLIGRINNISYCINEVLSDNSLWNEFSKAIIENIPELTDKFNKIIEKRFLENNEEMLKKVELEIEDKENKVNELLKQCTEYETKLSKLENQKIEFEQKIKDMENTHNNLKISLMNKVSDIKKDMSGFISEMALLEIIGVGNSNNIANRKKCCVKLSNLTGEEVDALFDINEFVDVLALNLEIAGIETENRVVVSKFITASIKQNSKMLLLGKFATSVANAISKTICGRNADIISVMSANIELDEVIEKIKICKSNVVLIENIINLNEIVALQLSRMNFDKLIIFANDISETISFIPNSLLNRFNLLCLDYICEKELKEEFSNTNSIKVEFENKYNKFTYKAAKEELEKLTGKCINSNSHCVIKSELVAIIDDMGGNEGIYSWLLCEVIPYFLIINNKEIAEEIIEILQLSEKYSNKLQKIIG